MSSTPPTRIMTGLLREALARALPRCRFVPVVALAVLQISTYASENAPSRSPGTLMGSAERCPTPRACQKVERLREACDGGRKGSCDLFVNLFAELMPAYDCGYPAIWKCEASQAYRTLSRLTTPPALRVFGSPEFREILSGEDADYWPLSVHAQRSLVVGDGDIDGPGPRLKVNHAAVGALAKASSTLKPQGRNRYDPDLAFDGLPFTAWCEGSAGAGVGEWLEFSLGSRRRPFHAFHVVPGYAKTQQTYRSNGAPTRVRISSCADAEASFEAELNPIDPLDFNAAAFSIVVPKGALKGEGRCVRFTILEVREGTMADTCISEITPSY